jgi:flagellar hook-associated protein 3 FlgL
MIQTFSATTEIFLSNLALSKQRASRDMQEMSSGYRVTSPSDAPADVISILQIQNNIALTKQTTSNLTRLKGEVDTGEATLATVVTLLQNANVLAAQALGPSQTADTRQALALQVRDIQEQMVGLSQTNADGRYIFSGDNEGAAQYSLDTTNLTTGVAQAFTTEETQQIADVGGTFTPAITAQDIFDQRDSSDNPTASNVFAALQQLYNGLTNNDSTVIGDAIDDIKASSVHVNLQLAFYGTVQNRISSSLTVATRYQTQWTQQLSTLRDADVAAVISDLQANETQQSAALASQANFSPQSLFDYLK